MDTMKRKTEARGVNPRGGGRNAPIWESGPGNYGGGYGGGGYGGQGGCKSLSFNYTPFIENLHIRWRIWRRIRSE